MPHPLQTLLQLDAAGVAHLAYILDHLSPSCLAPSPHLQKWVAHITSLMHSKDPAVRWAAICIAHRMSFLSVPLLLENAQSWVGIISPSLSKPEPVPVLRASTRYLTLVLCSAAHNLEFQRQVAIPIVPRVSSALLTIAESHDDQDLKTSSIRALAHLVPLYPSLHKALSQRLLALCHQTLSGSVHRTADSLLDATADLYAVMHFLGGKVSWSALLALRTTFPTSAQLYHKAIAHSCSPNGKLPDAVSYADAAGDPLLTVALNLDRLRCGVDAIAALLSVPVNRPVRLPIGHLTALCWGLLANTHEEEGQAHVDFHVRVAESAVVPQIWMHACRLLSSLAQTTQELLAPHTSRLIMVILSHLEHNLEPPQRRAFLQCVFHLLHFCPVVGATLAINRLLKAVIVTLSPLRLHQPREESSLVATSQSRSSKKRRREYEAVNKLSAVYTTVCATTDECETLIAALDVLEQCLLNAELLPSTRSLASRVLMSILMSLPSIPSSCLSSDPSFHAMVTNKVRGICVESVQGTAHAMSKGTSLVLNSFVDSLTSRDKIHSRVDLLLHPRRPPYVRTLPSVESHSLASADESAEETATRQSLEFALDHGETSLKPTQSEPMVQMCLNQHAAQNPPQERESPSSVKSHPQTSTDTNVNLSTEALAPPVAPLFPPSQAVIAQTGMPSPIPLKELTTGIYMAPMSVDESDHEEVPTIDLGSDSDA